MLTPHSKHPTKTPRALLTVSSFFLPAIPAIYAWQVYGWGIGIAVFVVMAALLSALAWTFFLRGWPLRWLLSLRIALIIVSMFAIGISAMEQCNLEMTACHRIFSLGIGTDWLRTFPLIIPFLLYAFVQHEVAEWSYERRQGLQGSFASFGMFVDASATLGTCGLYILLIAYAFDHSWQRAIALYVATILVGVVDQIVPIFIKRTGKLAFLSFRLVCVAAFYVMLIYICFHLSWFGLWKPGADEALQTTQHYWIASLRSQ
jgi:hypothetical protein